MCCSKLERMKLGLSDRSSRELRDGALPSSLANRRERATSEEDKFVRMCAGESAEPRNQNHLREGRMSRVCVNDRQWQSPSFEEAATSRDRDGSHPRRMKLVRVRQEAPDGDKRERERERQRPQVLRQGVVEARRLQLLVLLEGASSGD